MNTHDKNRLVNDLEGTTEALKGMKQISYDMLNVGITPEMEMQLPDDVKKSLREARQSYNLKDEKGDTMSVKQKMDSLNETLDTALKQAAFNQSNRQGE